MKNRLSKKDDLPLALRLLSILLLVLVVVLMGLPMLNVLAVSLSTQAKSDSPGLVLLPARKRKLVTHSERMGHILCYGYEGTENGFSASCP